MENNRKGIIKEVIAVLIFGVLLLTVGGYLVRNVVMSVRSLDVEAEKTDHVLNIGDLEKALQEIAGKITPVKKVIPPSEPKAPLATDRKKAEVKQVRFFEAGKEIPAPKDRVYNNQFSRQARYIYTEVNYKNNSYQVEGAEIPVIIQYYNAAGQQIADRKGTVRPKKEWASASFAVGWGPADSGSWRTGQYTVKVFLDGEHVGEYNFSID